MTIKKRYLEDRKTCSVTFVIDKPAAGSAQTAAVAGEFNDWDPGRMPMKRRKDGSFAATAKLACGKSYEFRYVVDDGVWQNEWFADDYAPSGVCGSDNCVIQV